MLTNFSTAYLVTCKVYTNVGGRNSYTMGCPPVSKVIHSLKLVADYLHVQADNLWYNYYLTWSALFGMTQEKTFIKNVNLYFNTDFLINIPKKFMLTLISLLPHFVLN